MNPKEKIVSGMTDFVRQLKQVDEYHDIMQTIIETHIKFDSTDEVIDKIQQHIVEVLRINPAPFIQYLIYPEFIRIEELPIDEVKYKRVLSFINSIKTKYGPLMRDWVQASKNPFLLSGVEINIANREATHGLKVIRCDGECLYTQFNCELLFAILTNMTQGAIMCIDKGIYNLSKQGIENYLKVNGQLVHILNGLISND